jgi:hypothetical protein
VTRAEEIRAELAERLAAIGAQLDFLDAQIAVERARLQLALDQLAGGDR